MEAEQAYLFRHALLRDAAYQLQLPGDRARLHRLALELVEQLVSPRGPLQSPHPAALEMAGHARMAREGADADAELAKRELRYLKLASMYAQQVFDMGGMIACDQRIAAMPGLPVATRVQALRNVVFGCFDLGRAAEARRFLEQALALAEQIAGHPLHVDILVHQGRALKLEGQHAQAHEVFLRALELALKAGDGETLARTRIDFSTFLHERGEHAQAERELLQALEFVQRVNFAPGLAIVRANLGPVVAALGRAAEAVALLSAALAGFEAGGDSRGQGVTLARLAAAYAIDGDYQKAERALERALALVEQARDNAHVAEFLVQQGELRERQGRHHEAREQAIRALALFTEHGYRAGREKAAALLKRSSAACARTQT